MAEKDLRIATRPYGSVKGAYVPRRILLVTVIILLTLPAALTEHLTLHQTSPERPVLQVSHSKHFPSSFLRITKGGRYPLLDQPNLSVGHRDKEGEDVAKDADDVIQGSKNAFTVTKLEYLKKEWCKSEPVRQTIRREGCLKRTILNRFCYGQCNSFFIPRRRRDGAAFKSCAFCRPRRTHHVWVTLHCPARRRKIIRKKVLIIKKCKCMALRLE